MVIDIMRGKKTGEIATGLVDEGSLEKINGISKEHFEEKE